MNNRNSDNCNEKKFNKDINNEKSNENDKEIFDKNDKEELDDNNILYRLSLNPNKGGLQNVDKEKINKIIYDVSKGSAFFNNAKEKEKAHYERIKEMKKKYLFLKSQPMEYEKQQMKNLMNKMEKERDLSQYIVHVDMDAFYASVEELDNPELKNKPMAVGSKSMLSTANYEARKYGVRSAMPGYIALKLCKDLIIVPTRFKRYHELSHQIRDIIANYDPDYCPASVDEVYLNITNFLNDHPNYTPSKTTEEIRQEIFKKTKLTASAGIAPNVMLAKICSDMNKPNGQTELKNNPDDIMNFLKDLPIGKVSGIGKVAEKTLNELGIKTCGELKENMVYIKELFKPASYQFLLSASLGLGRTTIENKWERKSISIERTFLNTSEKQKLENKLFEISCKLAEDVKNKNLKGKSVTLKLKTSSFETLTRCLTISKYIYKQEDLYKIGKKILSSYMEEHPNQSYRLMGLRLSSFLDEKNGSFLDKYVKVIENNKNTVDILTQQKEYECPVCFKMIKVDGIMNFEKHVNNCLSENNTEKDNKSNDSSELSNYNKKYKINEENKFIQKITNNNNVNYVHKNDKNNKIVDILTRQKEYECPVCYKIIKVDSIMEFEKHVNNCLSENDTNRENSNENSSKSKDFSMKYQLVEENNYDHSNGKNNNQKGKQVIEDYIPMNNSKIINDTTDTIQQQNGQRSDDNQSDDQINKIQCPICEQIIICSSNEELNRHVDICLNNDIIKNL